MQLQIESLITPDKPDVLDGGDVAEEAGDRWPVDGLSSVSGWWVVSGGGVSENSNSLEIRNQLIPFANYYVARFFSASMSEKKDADPHVTCFI